jgi:acyl-CoA reductase-like NAD-dependent aldehyde dehydrogenase
MHPPDLDMIIGGERVGALSGDRSAVINPATEETSFTVPAGGAADADRAVAAAAAAFEPWRKTPATRRGELLSALAGY